MQWEVEVAAIVNLEGLGERKVWLPLGTIDVRPRTRRDAVLRQGAEKFGVVPELGKPAREVRILNPGETAEGEVTSQPPDPQPPQTVVRLKEA